MKPPLPKSVKTRSFIAIQRGIDTETAVALIVNGFAKEVMNQLPMEFAVEAQKIIGNQSGRKRRLIHPTSIKFENTEYVKHKKSYKQESKINKF